MKFPNVLFTLQITFLGRANETLGKDDADSN